MQTKRITKIGLVVILIILVILFLHYIKVLRPIENLLMAAFKPVQEKVYKMSGYINSLYYERKSTNELKDENEKLKNELINLQITESKIREIEEQNNFLRRQIKFFSDRDIDGVVANVIGQSQERFQNILTIDKGERAGIKQGQAVVVADVMVGKIHDVSKYTSKVLMINDSFSKLAVTIQNKDQSIGILSGEYGLGLKISLIPQTEELAEGDYIITSGLEERVPRGIFVGQIDNVVYTEGELFKTAFIKSLIDFNKISIVSVLKMEYDIEDN